LSAVGSGYHGEVAVVGLGQTEFSARSGKSVLALAAEACAAAADDAGVGLDQVDGILSYSVFDDSVPTEAVATALGLGDVTYGLDMHLGGQSPCLLVMHAAMAIHSGLADTVLVYRAMNGRSGVRVGRAPVAGGGAPFRYPLGYVSYAQYMAMWARRYMIETGATQEDIGAVPIAQRVYAATNPRAMLGDKPLTPEIYAESRMIAEPFHLHDCAREVDGACALLLTSLERAREMARPPVVIAGSAYVAPRRSGLDIGDSLFWDDFTRNHTSYLRDDLWRRSGLGPEDVDVAEIYDCFSSVVHWSLEGLGFCGRGEAGPFIREGNTAAGGSLPVNTHGGMLGEGYLHGANTVAEAVRQVQGRAANQVDGAEVAVTTSGGMESGSALVLTAVR
jgi:acetyl-CoA acetyltransferase